MKSSFPAIAVCLVCLAVWGKVLCERPAWAMADAANLVSNANFESQEAWQSNSDCFSIVKDGRDGSTSLRFAADTSTAAARKFSQPISLAPGRLYKASAWMKTADVKGETHAPTITIEYFYKGAPVTQESWGAEYFVLAGQSGTSDWHELTTTDLLTPLTFDSAVLSCYVGAGITGTAWWDDLSFTPLPVPLIQSYILEPNYRGWMYGNYPSALRLHLSVNYQEHGLDNTILRLRTVLTSASGKTVLDSSRGVEHREISWSIDKPDELEAGKYELQISLIDDKQNTLATNEHLLVQWKGVAPETKCWIDQHQRLIVNGQPFFPIGMFAGLTSEEDLQRISESAFNCLMPYSLYAQPIEVQKQYLQDSERLGIKTIYSTKDLYPDWAINHLERLHGWKGKEAILSGLVETFRDNPNIIAWYINDEIGVADVQKVTEHYRITRDRDEDHPIWMCDFRPHAMRYFWDTSDVFGLDWYPIAWLPIDTVGKESAKSRDQFFSARPRWDVPQAHNLQIYNSGATTARPPTLEEMRNMSYQYLCNGATGLVMFCYDDLKRADAYLTSKKTFDEQWRDVKQVAAELKEISPILLSVEEPLPVTVAAGPEVRWLQKALGNVTHVFLVNSSRTPVSATLTTPRPGLQVRVDGAARGVSDQAGALPLLDLPAIGVCHVEIQH